MIRFKQKIFFWQAALMAAGTALPMMQASGQAKEAEAQNEKTQELMRAQNRKLEKIANAAKKDPSVAGKVPGVLQQKSYAAVNTSALASLGKTAWQAGKNAFGGGVKGNLAMGAAVGGTTYLAGKYIQRDMKKNKMDLDHNGNLVSKQYSAAGVTTSALNGLKKAGKVISNNKMTVGMGAAFGGVPLALNYQADKQQMKDQMRATQRQFARVIGSPNMMKGMIRGWNRFKAHPGQSTAGFVNNIASMGVGGTKNVQKFADGMIKQGTQNNSQLAVKAGEWMKNHKTAANLVTAAPVAAIGVASFDGTSKVMKKVGEKVDPGAYKYQNAKDKQAQLQQ